MSFSPSVDEEWDEEEVASFSVSWATWTLLALLSAPTLYMALTWAGLSSGWEAVILATVGGVLWPFVLAEGFLLLPSLALWYAAQSKAQAERLGC